jgi:hypothetical protein
MDIEVLIVKDLAGKVLDKINPHARNLQTRLEALAREHGTITSEIEKSDIDSADAQSIGASLNLFDSKF